MTKSSESEHASVPNVQNCPECASRLPQDAPRGLCPVCLLASALPEPEVADRPDRYHSPTTPGPARHHPLSLETLTPLFPQLEILSLLGQGGMGTVYKARQKKLDRLVALKIIRPEAVADPAFAERFHREARTLARLNHSHIVAIHDFGEVTAPAAFDPSSAIAVFYFVMEYVDGVNLRQILDEESGSGQLALSVIPQVCEALQFAHDEGIVHRDVKPENILIDQRGRVKIADFGLAKLVIGSAEDFTLTGTHQVMGTPRYMAPEQMERTAAVDHRADIYSLGVVLYETLTGRVPAGHFELPSAIAAVDPRFDSIALTAMARDAERRYPSAGRFGEALALIAGPSLRSCGATVAEGGKSVPVPSAGLSTFISREFGATCRWIVNAMTPETPNPRPAVRQSSAVSILQAVLAAVCCASMLLPWWDVYITDPDAVRGLDGLQLEVFRIQPAYHLAIAPLQLFAGCSAAVAMLLATAVAVIGSSRPTASARASFVSTVLVSGAIALLLLHRLEIGRLVIPVFGDPISRTPPTHFIQYPGPDLRGNAWLNSLDHELTLSLAAWSGFGALFLVLILNVAVLRWSGISQVQVLPDGSTDAASITCPGFLTAYFWLGLPLVLASFALVLFTQIWTNSTWGLMSLALIWFVFGAVGRAVGKPRDQNAILGLAVVAVPLTLGLVAFAIWQSHSGWPLLYILVAGVAALGGGATAEETLTEMAGSASGSSSGDAGSAATVEHETAAEAG